ncbi:MAG: hypothetical protein D6754_13085 [Alphaproteobacteria bacterium]|nr:MAG: hypothetical protein D6754_13085 [Alphaproteobacteria bacterium]
MLRTITLGSHMSVQGELVERLADGRLRVRVGQKSFDGWDVREDGEALLPQQASFATAAGAGCQTISFRS